MNNYCNALALICILLSSYNSKAQSINGSYVCSDNKYERIDVHNSIFKYYFTSGDNDTVIFAECPVRQVDNDVLMLESYISGDDFLGETVVSVSVGECPRDSVRIDISLPKVGTGCVNCHYSDSLSCESHRTECILANGFGTMFIPVSCGKSIIIQDLYYLPCINSISDFHYFETHRSLVRAFLLKNGNTVPLCIGGGARVSISSDAIKDELFDKSVYPGDFILVTESGLTWRGKSYRRTDDE